MPDLNYILQSLPAATGNLGKSETKFEQNLKIKLAVVGPSQTGKTALCGIFVEKEEKKIVYKMTLGMELRQKIVQIGGIFVHLNLIDFGGNRQYQILLRSLIAAVDAYLFVFDLTKQESLESLRNQITDLVSMNPQFAAVIVGNRSDLDTRRQVSRLQGVEFAASFRLPYMETSITDKSSVVECFKLIAKISAEQMASTEKARKATANTTNPKQPVNPTFSTNPTNPKQPVNPTFSTNPTNPAEMPLQAPPRTKKTTDSKQEAPKLDNVSSNVNARVLPSADEDDEF